jgi:predicted acyltransferase
MINDLSKVDPPIMNLTGPNVVNSGRRVASVDAYRGFVMLLMMGEVLRFSQMARAFPNVAIWKFLALHQSHVEWTGCTLHDMIQPSFSFLVGVALVFSLQGRKSQAESIKLSIFHAAWRSFLLIALGIFLRSVGRNQTNFTFEDTLTQIGLGYLPLFLIGLTPKRFWWIALIGILVGYWSLFAIYPVPAADFDYDLAGVKDWAHNATGLAAHWNKNTNAAWGFDRWFMNIFPRERPFLNNGGGYSTLSFIPTLGTMLMGLIAGDWLRSALTKWQKLGLFCLVGCVSYLLGWSLNHFGICPSVKRIWTPSWTLLSGGLCFLFLALFYLTNDLVEASQWSYPLRVIGRNSIAAYLISHLIESFLRSSFQTHFGKDVFKIFGNPYEPLVGGIVILLVYWLILFWMDLRKIYLRV